MESNEFHKPKEFYENVGEKLDEILDEVRELDRNIKRIELSLIQFRWEYSNKNIYVKHKEVKEN